MGIKGIGWHRQNVRYNTSTMDITPLIFYLSMLGKVHITSMAGAGAGYVT